MTKRRVSPDRYDGRRLSWPALTHDPLWSRDALTSRAELLRLNGDQDGAFSALEGVPLSGTENHPHSTVKIDVGSGIKENGHHATGDDEKGVVLLGRRAGKGGSGQQMQTGDVRESVAPQKWDGANPVSIASKNEIRGAFGKMDGSHGNSPFFTSVRTG